jgi:hypothetical protein
MSDYLSRLVSRGAKLALPATLHSPPVPPAGPDFPDRITFDSGEAAGRTQTDTSPSRQEVENHSATGPAGGFPPDTAPSLPPVFPAVHPAAPPLPSQPEKNGHPIAFEPGEEPHAATPPPRGHAGGNTSVLPVDSTGGPGVLPQRRPVTPADAFEPLRTQPDRSPETPALSTKQDPRAQEAPPIPGPAPVAARSIYPGQPTGRDASRFAETNGLATSTSLPEFTVRSDPRPASLLRSLEIEPPSREPFSHPASSLPSPIQSAKIYPVLSGSGSFEIAEDGKTGIPPTREMKAIILPTPAIKLPAAFPSPAEPAAPVEPAPVRIHIGTIEVRAAAPPPSAAPAPPPVRGFAEYDRIRNYENWEMD